MKCPNCGYENVAYTDVYCPRCGARQLMPTNNQHHNINHHQEKSNNSWIIITLAVVIALAIVGGALYLGLSHQDEESMWEKCEQSQEIADYKKYIDTYPNGEHFDEAKHMYNLLIGEKTMWEQVQSSNDENQIRTFITNHPNSKYLKDARDKLDDVMWNNVIVRNTKQDVERYMREFPSGKHIGDARNRYEEFRLSELTLEERDQVKALVGRFLSGLEQWSLADMLSTCNFEMSDFMGKHSAGHEDVREYFNAYRDSGVDSISFTSLAVDVRKNLDANHQPQYRVDFTTTRQYWRGEGVNTSLMRGKALVDSYFRFDELSMDKVSDSQ